MKKFIYKITNKINGKKYIGQTNNPKRRFLEHINRGYEKEVGKVLYYAFDKYGVDNFTFEVIEEVENYNEREKYWIDFYNSFEDGYNMTPGGEEPPCFTGESSHMCSHSEEQINQIIYLLQNTKLSTKDIAKTFNYNVSSINRINNGEIWFNSEYNYPLRKENTQVSIQQRADNIINDLLTTNLTQKEIANKYGVGRTTITAINNGQNNRRDNLTYPLRGNKE